MKYFLMLFRFTKHAFVYFVVCLPLILVGMVILAVVLPFIKEGQERLPKCLAWFDNDSGIRLGYPGGDGLAGDPNYRRMRAEEGHTSIYWERYTWLALRNPINYFSYKILGHKFVAGDTVTKLEGPIDPGMTMDGGLKILEMETIRPYPTVLYLGLSSVPMIVYPTKTLYEYHYVKAYTLFGKKLCFWARFGWKINHPSEVITGETTEWVFTCNPVKSQ